MGSASDTIFSHRYGADIPDEDLDSIVSDLEAVTSRLRRAGPDRRVRDVRASGGRRAPSAPMPSVTQWPVLSFGDVGEAVAGELFGDDNGDSQREMMARLRQSQRLQRRASRKEFQADALSARAEAALADDEAGDPPQARILSQSPPVFPSQSQWPVMSFGDIGESVVDELFGDDDFGDDFGEDSVDGFGEVPPEDLRWSESFGCTPSAYYGLYSGTDEVTQQISDIESRVVGIVKQYISMLRVPKLLSLNKQRDQVIDGGASSDAPQAVALEREGLGLLSGVTQPIAGELWTLARKRDNLRRVIRGGRSEPIGTPPRLV